MKTLSNVILGAFLLITVQGCTSGRVFDSAGNACSEASVLAEAQCAGAGCSSHNLWGVFYAVTTDNNGNYFYDPYGEVVAPEDAMFISPNPGEEAMRLIIGKESYDQVEFFHRPDYQEITVEGETYLFTACPNVYLCTSGATDSDSDGICDEAEAMYGTNPNNSDTDGDSLSDAAEIFGFNGLDLKYYGADPLHKDVFLELDWYPGLKPSDTAIDNVVNAFAVAPVSNPDGTSGINLHIVVDDEIAAADVDDDLNPVWTDFDVIKNKYFEPRRAWAFHYVLFANQFNGGTWSGISRSIPAADFLVTLGTWTVPGGTVEQQTGTLMHELGHNLGLRHGGNDDVNYKVNYLSIMNYNYQLWGLFINPPSCDTLWDYSRLQIASLNENGVVETNGFDPAPGSPTTEIELANYSFVMRHCSYGNVLFCTPSNQNVDFNLNQNVEGFSQAIDLNGDCDTNDIEPDSHNDWDNIIYNGGGIIGDDGLGVLGTIELLVTPEEMDPCITEEEANNNNPISASTL